MFHKALGNVVSIIFFSTEFIWITKFLRQKITINCLLVIRFTMGRMPTLQSWWGTAETLCLRPVFTGAVVSTCTSRWGPISRFLDEGSKPSMSPVGALQSKIPNKKQTFIFSYFYNILLEKSILYLIAKGCGGILNGEDDGVITSPNYPNSYDMMSNCSWLIRADHSGMLS